MHIHVHTCVILLFMVFAFLHDPMYIASMQEAKRRLDELLIDQTQEYEAGVEGLKCVEAPEEAAEAPAPAEEPSVRKPKKVRRRGSREKLSVVIGGSEAASNPAGDPLPAKPKKAAPPAPASLLALPAPTELWKNLSGYDPNVEDAQDPRAFEREAPPKALNVQPPAKKNDEVSPPRPTSLLSKFSAAAAGRVCTKGKKRRPREEDSEDEDADLLSPESLRSNLAKYLKDSKDSWFALRIYHGNSIYSTYSYLM